MPCRAPFSTKAPRISALRHRCSNCAPRIWRSGDDQSRAAVDGYGYCTDFRVERLMRDAKITQIWESSSEIHRQLIGPSFIVRE